MIRLWAFHLSAFLALTVPFSADAATMTVEEAFPLRAAQVQRGDDSSTESLELVWRFLLQSPELQQSRNKCFSAERDEFLEQAETLRKSARKAISKSEQQSLLDQGRYLEASSALNGRVVCGIKVFAYLNFLNEGLFSSPNNEVYVDAWLHDLTGNVLQRIGTVYQMKVADLVELMVGDRDRFDEFLDDFADMPAGSSSSIRNRDEALADLRAASEIVNQMSAQRTLESMNQMYRDMRSVFLEAVVYSATLPSNYGELIKDGDENKLSNWIAYLEAMTKAIGCSYSGAFDEVLDIHKIRCGSS
jgi:hypothetical protein